MNTSKPLGIGSRVKYRREFLRSCGMFTGPIPFARGTITDVRWEGQLWTMATIKWDNDHFDEIPKKVLLRNLIEASAQEVC